MKSETGHELEFRMAIADNYSSDDSLAIRQPTISSDREVIGIANAAN